MLSGFCCILLLCDKSGVISWSCNIQLAECWSHRKTSAFSVNQAMDKKNRTNKEDYSTAEFRLEGILRSRTQLVQYALLEGVSAATAGGHKTLLIVIGCRAACYRLQPPYIRSMYLF